MAFCFASDQLLKVAVRSSMVESQSVQVLGDVFRFTYVENRAAVMGISLLPLWVVTLASLPAMAIMAWWMWRRLPSRSWLARILPWVVGGAAGNLFDRLIFGQVTDMLDVDIPNIALGVFQLERWWVFNLADCYIFTGMILLIVFSFTGKLEDEPAPIPAGSGDLPPLDAAP
jgi:signal peptidase II